MMEIPSRFNQPEAIMTSNDMLPMWIGTLTAHMRLLSVGMDIGVLGVGVALIGPVPQRYGNMMGAHSRNTMSETCPEVSPSIPMDHMH